MKRLRRLLLLRERQVAGALGELGRADRSRRQRLEQQRQLEQYFRDVATSDTSIGLVHDLHNLRLAHDQLAAAANRQTSMAAQRAQESLRRKKQMEVLLERYRKERQVAATRAEQLATDFWAQHNNRTNDR